MTRRGQRGFTLTELMVVVAILGVLVTMAAISLRADPRPIDVATRVGALAQEASRRAIMAGPLRPDVATALGIRYRTRIAAAGAPGSSPVFALQLLVEDPAPAATAQWQTVQTYRVPRVVTGAAFSTQIGAHAAVPLATDWATFELTCEPNGSCTPRTLFFESGRGATHDRKARISVMPLGTSTYLRRDWN